MRDRTLMVDSGESGMFQWRYGSYCRSTVKRTSIVRGGRHSLLLQAWKRSFPVITPSPGVAFGSALKRVAISKFPLNTQTGVGEKGYFWNFGLGKVTCW